MNNQSKKELLKNPNDYNDRCLECKYSYVGDIYFDLCCPFSTCKAKEDSQSEIDFNKGYDACNEKWLDILGKIKADFISAYPKNYMGGLELGGDSCVFSLNKILKIIDKHTGKESEE